MSAKPPPWFKQFVQFNRPKRSSDPNYATYADEEDRCGGAAEKQAQVTVFLSLFFLSATTWAT